MTPSADEISRPCQLVNELSGIQWDATKGYLIETRLVPLLKAFGFANFRQLVEGVRRGQNPDLRRAFIDAITTRETLFFRDETPFQALREKLLPEIIAAKRRPGQSRRLRLWSAACSSGQEPYSLAILLHELIPDISRWEIEILATDLSPAALVSAARGLYTDFEVARGLSPDVRGRHFEQTPDGWAVRDHLKRPIRFERRNLLEPFEGLTGFDVVFCRNVAIYFDLATRRDLFERLANTLEPHGVLFAGCSETLTGYGDRWKPRFHGLACYYLPGNDSPSPDASEAPLATNAPLGSSAIQARAHNAVVAAR